MKKVLVIDDTKNIRTLLTTCLEVDGFDVTSAKDGNQALDLLLQNHYDLIFLDIKMPEISGTEVLKRIRDKGITTPVIIMTAFATVKNAVECTRLGAVAYLQKPFTADKVKSIVMEIDASAHIEEYIKRGDYSLALDMLKRAISLDPTSAELYRYFSEVYKGLGDHENENKFYQTYRLFRESENTDD